MHKEYTDCWTSVNGIVYDITLYCHDHPGGNIIYKAAGKDGTTYFSKTSIFF